MSEQMVLFETWLTSTGEHNLSKDANGKYLLNTVQLACEAWQAGYELAGKEVVKEFYVEYLKPMIGETMDVMLLRHSSYDEDFFESITDFIEREIKARANQFIHGADLDEDIENSEIVIDKLINVKNDLEAV